MNKIFFMFFYLCLIFVNGNSLSMDTIKLHVNGDIGNLHDGKVYLYKNTFNDVIDSAETKNGKFYFKYKFNEKDPQYIGFFHYRKGVKTLFFFPKKDLKTNKIKYIDRIMSDSILIFNELLNINKEISSATTIYSNTKVKAGKQTAAFLDSETDLFENINPDKIQLIKKKIIKYPYSYHLLYEIEKNKNNINLEDLEILINIFDNKVQESSTFNNIRNYVELKKNSEKKDIIPMLKNEQNIYRNILNKEYKKHIIIFWASWCGPCLKEIPVLKKISENNKDVELVSISIDSNVSLWLDRIKKENMKWKQFIASEKEQRLLEAGLDFSNIIPYLIVVDNNFKIIHKITGSITEKDIQNILEPEKL